MFMCTTRFNIQSEQLALMDEYLSTQEKHTKKEQDDTEQKKDEFDPISDEEEEEEIEGLSGIELSVAQRHGLRAVGKRPATDDQLIELDDEETPLPNYTHLQGGSSTQRRSSGRVLKRIREDTDFVYN